jgi:hypothetical protein
MLHHAEPSPLEAFTADALQASDGKTIFLEKDGIVFPVRVKLNPKADRLFVMLNGAVDRKTMEMPAFARWNWGKILDGHVIAVCDPTLYLDDGLRLGWFLGSSTKSAVPGLVEIAERAADHLKIAAGRTVFYGSSGGGFAAIAAACRLREGRALAINPQVDVTKYYPKALAAIKRALGGECAFAMVCLDPRRVNLNSSIDEARWAGLGTRLAIYQNSVDRFHHKNHFLNLAANFGVPPEGGRSPEEDILGVIYSSPEGHSGEPPEVVKKILSEGIPFLLEEPRPPKLVSGERRKPQTRPGSPADVPPMLSEVAELIFSFLPSDASKVWLDRFAGAIASGADLDLVVWRLMHWALSEPALDPDIHNPAYRDLVDHAAEEVKRRIDGYPPRMQPRAREASKLWSASLRMLPEGGPACAPQLRSAAAALYAAACRPDTAGEWAIECLRSCSEVAGPGPGLPDQRKYMALADKAVELMTQAPLRSQGQVASTLPA